MIAAERLLLKNALEDVANRRFVLLSDRLGDWFYLCLFDLEKLVYRGCWVYKKFSDVFLLCDAVVFHCTTLVMYIAT